jgi:hypothetical protein
VILPGAWEEGQRSCDTDRGVLQPKRRDRVEAVVRIASLGY